VLAVNVKLRRGRFANVDRAARRWLFRIHVSLLRDSSVAAWPGLPSPGDDPAADSQNEYSLD